MSASVTAHAELKFCLIALLKQLGLHSYATSLQDNALQQKLTPTHVASSLNRYNVHYHVQPMTISTHNKSSASLLAKPSKAGKKKVTVSPLSHSSFPYMFVPDNAAAMLMRKQGEQYEVMLPQTNESEKWLPLEALDLNLTGQVFVIDAIPSGNKNTFTFFKHLTRRAKLIKPLVLLSLMSNLTGLAVPLFTMVVYDNVIGGQAKAELPLIALGAALSLSIFIISRLARGYIISLANNRLVRDLSAVKFHQLVNMPLMLLSRVGVSNHIARMKNAEKVRSMLSGPSGAALVDLPFVAIPLTVIALLSGYLALVPVFMLILFYFIMKLSHRYTTAAAPTISTQYQDLINRLARSAVHLKVGGNSEGWNKKFVQQCQQNCQQNFLYAKRNGLTAAIAHAMSLYTSLATIFVGIFLVLNHSITTGALIACVMLIWRITGPAQLAFSSSQKISLFGTSVKQFDQFMQVQTEQSELRLIHPDINQAPSISFKQVSLRYSADTEPALTGITFDIEPGECVAIIGPNSSGKTSALLAAIGMIEPQAGYVSVNGKNIKQYNPESFRHWAAFCPAHTDLFPGSLAENLAVTKLDASDEELIEALIAAGGAPLLAAFNGDIHINLFSRGTCILTEAEANYISLARALLRQSKLLVLDEPIANQDPHAKALLIAKLQSLKGKATVVFSSHDQDIIQQADKVIILNNGQLIYAGPAPEAAPNSPNNISAPLNNLENNINE